MDSEKILIEKPDKYNWAIPETAGQGEWPTSNDGELCVDVYETATHIVVQTAIAGVKPDDFSLSLSNDLLTIRGKREFLNESPEERQYLCRECYWGNFSRSILLPHSVDIRKSKATLKNGILNIALSKAPKNTTNNIPIIVLDEE